VACDVTKFVERCNGKPVKPINWSAKLFSYTSLISS
jgi:hypothetical protein